MELDFIVIGAQKAGTTSLWQYLRGHPQIFMPSSKELPLFTAPGLDSGAVEEGVGKLFAEAPAGALLAKVTPDYMIGQGEIRVEAVAQRIAATFPRIKLIALLRDPIERAVSGHMMAVRRGEERRPVEVALEEELTPAALERARREPSPTGSYLIAGEYGRILSAYWEAFPADRLLVAYSEDLTRDPGAVLDQVVGFLGLPTGFRPEGLGLRHFRGGARKLVDPEAERALRDFLDVEVVPRMKGSAAQHRRALDFFLETWNVAPQPPPPISESLRVRLEEHFVADTGELAELGVATPWLARWDRGR